MQNILYLFEKLNDQDLDWLIGTGVRKSLAKDAVLIEANKPLHYFYITLNGRFYIEQESHILATITAGEVLGEMSLFDVRNPVVSIVAAEESNVVLYPLARLRSHLGSDTGFASRFYLALGVYIADRFRELVQKKVVSKVEHLTDVVEELGELSDDFLDNSSLAGMRFDEFRRAWLE